MDLIEKIARIIAQTHFDGTYDPSPNEWRSYTDAARDILEAVVSELKAEAR